MKILLASSNPHKKQELEELLPGHTLILPKEVGLSFSCTEDGLTFKDNASIKANALFKVSKGLNLPVLADDSGLLVSALPGQLGVHTARFGAKDDEHLLSAHEKNMLLLKMLEKTPFEERDAMFVCSLVMIMPNGRVLSSEGIAKGYILYEETGEFGFGYDPVFFNLEANKPQAMLYDAKNTYSHRGKASRELLSLIEQEEKMSKEIPLRKDVNEKDKWDLSSLYKDENEFNSDLEILKKEITKADSFKGKLSDSPENLLSALKWFSDTSRLSEKLGSYAFLNQSAEAQNPQNQRRFGIINQICTDLSAATSYMDPEILAIENIDTWIKDKAFDDYRVYLKKLLRQKEHTLSPAEESILAKQSELQDTASQAFEVLTNVDMNFGKINDLPLSQSTYSAFMHDKDRSIREKAYKQFYETYRAHEQTIAKLYSGSVKQDIFNARVRGFNTALEAALYKDNVPLSVYTGLIEAVHNGFDSLHRYYSIKKRLLKVDQLRHYDVYVPVVDMPKIITPYEEAAKTIKTALAPLGEEYTDIIYKGLTSDGWVDRYENKGKRSGAFSAGVFTGNPYILINYKEDVLNSVFTLAHEGGHSMHSYYSTHNNPFMCYDYTIFEAEVASTFNEQLMAKYYMDNAKDKTTKAYIISKQLDDMVATLFRQTMFAEFELLCHTQVENGEPLTVESLRKTYRGLLEAYFGKEMNFEETSDLEGLRIPHFYRGYYVYKYATGISASIALSERVINGSKKELDDYLGFLKSGGSKFPIDSLKGAGVDMSTQAPINAAIAKFTSLLNEFDSLMS